MLLQRWNIFSHCNLQSSTFVLTQGLRMTARVYLKPKVCRLKTQRFIFPIWILLYLSFGPITTVMMNCQWTPVYELIDCKSFQDCIDNYWQNVYSLLERLARYYWQAIGSTLEHRNFADWQLQALFTSSLSVCLIIKYCCTFKTGVSCYSLTCLSTQILLKVSNISIGFLSTDLSMNTLNSKASHECLHHHVHQLSSPLV
jgi:hypothetical protein